VFEIQYREESQLGRHADVGSSILGPFENKVSFYSNIDIEVWMVILDWLGKGYRRELAAKVNQLGDRTFCGICQTWLHKYTKNVQLGDLYIKQDIVFNKDGKAEQNGVLKVYDNEGRKVRVPFADVEMPENVTGFDYIQIRFVETQKTLISIFFVYLYPTTHISATWTLEYSTSSD
jgi:hypothetical protein